MRSQRSVHLVLLIGFLSLFGVADSVPAAPPASHFAPTIVAVGPVFASSVSWYGFKRYWMGFVKNSDRVVVIVAIVGAAAVFIITRGKWM